MSNSIAPLLQQTILSATKWGAVAAPAHDSASQRRYRNDLKVSTSSMLNLSSADFGGLSDVVAHHCGSDFNQLIA